MSGYVCGLVWRAEIPGAGLTEKAICARYADYADDEGGSIYPSKARVAKQCCVSLPTVKRATRFLIAAGLLEVERASVGGDPNATTRYRLRVDRLRALAGDLGDAANERERARMDNPGHLEPGSPMTRVTGEPGSPMTPTRVTHDPGPGSPVTHDPSETPSVKHQKQKLSASADADGVETVWQAATPAMRRRSSKADVRKALALKSNPYRPDEIALALSRYVAHDADVLADRGQPALHRWIANNRAEFWLGEDWKAAYDPTAQLLDDIFAAALERAGGGHESSGDPFGPGVRG